MYHYLPTRMTKIKNKENAVCYQKCGPTENSDNAVGNTLVEVA